MNIEEAIRGAEKLSPTIRIRHTAWAGHKHITWSPLGYCWEDQDGGLYVFTPQNLAYCNWEPYELQGPTMTWDEALEAMIDGKTAIHVETDLGYHFEDGELVGRIAFGWPRVTFSALSHKPSLTRDMLKGTWRILND